jgi:hypothetical protein
MRSSGCWAGESLFEKGEFEKALYKLRAQVERLLDLGTQFRCIATRYQLANTP